MIISIQINSKNYRINTTEQLDISIPLNFNGEQPNAYGVEKARASVCESETLIGDTRRGGSCNFEQVIFIPHCNGTHTECVGHITHERISVRDCLQDAFIPAFLISVEPEIPQQTNETYAVELNENDKLITRKALENGIRNTGNEKVAEDFFQALIIRTLPNDESKLTREYLETVPPFFSIEALEFISELQIKHLLVDLPSIDRIFDGGKLSNHRIFWNVGQGAFEINENSSIYNTITELIYVPDKIKDGSYLLNLQIAPFASDASPSRPLLFEFAETD